MEHLEQKIDALRADVRQIEKYLVGETGTNGLFGRIRALEEDMEARRRTSPRLWALIGSLCSGLVTAVVLVVLKLKG